MDAWRCGTCHVRMRMTRRKTLVNTRSRRVRTDGRTVVLVRVRSSKKRLASSRPTTRRTCHRPVVIAVHILLYDCPSGHAWTARSLTFYVLSYAYAHGRWIGKTVQRIIGKAIAATITEDIQDSAGPLQVCAGHISGCEAAVHAMHRVYESRETEAVLLVGTTQGDPLAMAMYVIAITPLIQRLEDHGVKQAWYADDATAGGALKQLKQWWDGIAELGPDYSYFPNATKTWIVVEEEHLEEAKQLFQETGVSITADGKRHLGAAIGTPHFAAGYVQQKVAEWVGEVERLSSIAVTQPHAAYAAFTHGLKHKWTYLIRTIPDISVLIQPLEDAIRHKFLPSLTGQNALNDETRELMALPVRHGGLGIINPSHNNQIQHQSSEHITAPLVSLIVQQSHTYPQEAKAEQLRAKEQAVKLRKQWDATTATELKDKLPNNIKRALEASTEKGASSWLATLPITEHGFALHKGAFRDTLCLR